MRHAIADEFAEIYAVFRHHKQFFPHIRTDALKRRIAAGECIYDRQVVITYQLYKRRVRISRHADVYGEKGDCILHQIATLNLGGASSEVLRDFFKFTGANTYLTVRSENARAVAFYKKMGMEVVGSTRWGKSDIPGLIFCRRAHVP